MDGWRLSTAELDAWVDSLARTRRVVAPVAEGGVLLFREVRDGARARLHGVETTAWSPKEWLFPQTETLLTWHGDGDTVEVEPAVADTGEQVLVGVRPCDAAGLCRLDDVLLSGERDELYAARREHTAVVSVACEAARPSCFCTAVGGSPDGTEGADLQLAPLPEERWLLTVVTARGRALVDGACATWTEAAGADRETARGQAERVAATITRAPLPEDAAARLATAFGSPLWASVSDRCLGCGVCAHVCPSCSCFDVTETAGPTCGTRCRSWDTCALARFTVHASGHNPRGAQAARYRQRVLHKFSWFTSEHGRPMCTGCGRCLDRCPVGVDIHAAVARLCAAGEPS